ncbi:uncharacterized protein FA14DRAFT_191115 [Meira miltonrushii]|uniref:F-box domain-containing protein n=1 Tax=Meira miltonrushii TaxID=1280837 RepID=A0A316VAC4_9BASI|nr:uncharacterized protein FA14DRAFT_191115 [Meira miltonrushii]PWN34018.1 hypothetical protein FA14DRAFT_191115 [Meira miltonrushii]
MSKDVTPIFRLEEWEYRRIFSYLEPAQLAKAEMVCKDWLKILRPNWNVPALRLPLELYGQIFSYFDPTELTKVESVCKKWYNVSRSMPKLWEDGLFESDKPAILTKKGNKKVACLVKRSGGKLTDLAIQINLTYCDLNSIRKFCILLERSGVQNLWIEFVPKDYEGDNLEILRAETERYLRAIGFVLKSVCKCSKLRSLHIEAAGIGSLLESFPSNMKDQPIVSCKLERLTLIGLDTENLFQDNLIVSMIDGAKVIEIQNKHRPISAKSALRIFELTRDTLQECHLDVEESENKSWLGSNHKLITLSQLSRLHLSNFILPREVDEEEERDERITTGLFSNVTLIIPRLLELYVEGRPPQTFQSAALTEPENLECFTMNIVQASSALVDPSRFSACKKLRRLVIQRFGQLQSTYVYAILANLCDSPIQELIVENNAGKYAGHIEYDADDFVNMLRIIGMQHSNKRTKPIFGQIFLQGRPKVSKQNLNWLIANYADFLTYHPYLWQKMSRCSMKDLEGYVRTIKYFSRHTPLLSRRAHLGEPIGVQYS